MFRRPKWIYPLLALSDIISLHACLWSYTARHHRDLYNNVIMSAMMSQLTSLPVVYSTVYLGTDQINHQSSAPLGAVTEFPAERASNAENISIWRRHHDEARYGNVFPLHSSLIAASVVHKRWGFFRKMPWRKWTKSLSNFLIADFSSE